MTADELRERIVIARPEWRELVSFLPSSHVQAICQQALDGVSEEEILRPENLGGENFDITVLLTNLASIATLYCAVITTVDWMQRQRGSKEKPRVDEVLNQLPLNQKSKPDVELVVEDVVAKLAGVTLQNPK
jgi:hypothetical protein